MQFNSSQSFSCY